MRFLHVMIRVKDLEKSLDFYTKLLDMNMVRTIMLEDNAFGHFAFEVDSMDEFTKKLHAHGYEYLYEPFYMREAGSKIAFIKVFK